MNDNAKQLVAAMRSGDYKQGMTGHLRSHDDCYCPLGVGCELYHIATGELAAVLDENCEGYSYGGHTDFMPQGVCDWLGLRSNNGSYGPYGIAKFLDSLISDNDILEKSFAEIADIIESEPEGLFVNTE